GVHSIKRSGASGADISGDEAKRTSAWIGIASKRCSNASLCLNRESLTRGRRAWHDAGYPREEPGAGKLHARICEGESRMAELLDRDRGGSGGIVMKRSLNQASGVLRGVRG